MSTDMIDFGVRYRKCFGDPTVLYISERILVWSKSPISEKWDCFSDLLSTLLASKRH